MNNDDGDDDDDDDDDDSTINFGMLFRKVSLKLY